MTISHSEPESSAVAVQRQGGWFVLRGDGALTLARQLPPRFDVAAQTCFALPPGAAVSRQRLAQQIRQDLWRALRGLRGFSPVVRVVRAGDLLKVMAGGRVAARKFPKAETERQIAALLAAPKQRARWLRCAGARV
ncbi:MAG: hypothetical protein JKX69_02440 [Rhodobacteraceae bacterium]|nr:hypothetical protein [Paracoccaceae bacterium]